MWSTSGSDKHARRGDVVTPRRRRGERIAPAVSRGGDSGAGRRGEHGRVRPPREGRERRDLGVTAGVVLGDGTPILHVFAVPEGASRRRRRRSPEGNDVAVRRDGGVSRDTGARSAGGNLRGPPTARLTKQLRGRLAVNMGRNRRVRVLWETRLPARPLVRPR